MGMKLKLLFLGLVSWSTGQWINPDEFERMRASWNRPSLQAPNNNAVNQVANELITIGNTFGNQVADEQFPPSPVIELEPSWSEHVNRIISNGITKFTLDMDKVISRDQGRSLEGSRQNVIFSPLSIAGALALVLLGSSGRTFEEVSRILGLESGVDISKNSEVVHHMFGLLLNTVGVSPGATPGPQADFASGIFLQDGYPIRSEFRNISESVYKSDVINLDFRTQAQQKINDWVKRKTNGKIANILEAPPSSDANVIIASALYFNGEWDRYFDEELTNRKPFTVAPGEVIDVDMMFNGGDFLYFEDRQLQAKIIGLPYKGHRVTMYVVLPNAKSVDALRDLKNRLSANTLENLITNMKNETCIVALPRMKLSSTLSLSSALESLGLTTLFDPLKSDLSLLSPGYNLMTENMGSGPPTNVNPTPGPQLNPNNTLIFTRSGAPGTRQNYFTYVDKKTGHIVEQWSNGFSLRRIGRSAEEKSRRNVLTGSDSVEDMDHETERIDRSLRRHARHTGKFVKRRFSRSTPEEKDSYKMSRKNTEQAESLGLGGSKYRSEKKTKLSDKRHKRQAVPRPIDDRFLDYLSRLNLPSYGLDDLRNNGALRNPGLYASDVLHKVEIDVTEKGTEAAAATAIILTKDGNKKIFRADHPFLFFIRHESTKLILFWGTVNTPTPNFPRA